MRRVRVVNDTIRVGRFPVGRSVKLADIDDNLDLSRIANPTEKDLRAAGALSSRAHTPLDPPR